MTASSIALKKFKGETNYGFYLRQWIGQYAARLPDEDRSTAFMAAYMYLRTRRALPLAVYNVHDYFKCRTEDLNEEYPIESGLMFGDLEVVIDG